MKIILQTKAETLAWLASHDETCRESFDVISDWLCDELDRFEQDSGFVYNAPAQARIIAENGLSKQEAERRVEGYRQRTEGGLLGVLVYKAQSARRVRALERGGWIRASQQSLAGFAGQKIRALSNGSLSGEFVAKVKDIGGKIRLCPLRSRKAAYAEYQDLWINPKGAQ